MKNLILSAALLALSSLSAAQDVGVSINIGQPGFYGRIDIGNTAPQVIYREPVLVQRPARYIAEPLYLRVPPGHAKKWSKHCRAYNACGRRVYFVRDSWYLNDYAPRYRAEHGYRGGHDGRRDYRERQDVREHHDRRDERGHGNKHNDKHNGRHHDKHDGGHGNGKGHGNGHGRD